MGVPPLQALACALDSSGRPNLPAANHPRSHFYVCEASPHRTLKVRKPNLPGSLARVDVRGDQQLAALLRQRSDSNLDETRRTSEDEYPVEPCGPPLLDADPSGR